MALEIVHLTCLANSLSTDERPSYHCWTMLSSLSDQCFSVRALVYALSSLLRTSSNNPHPIAAMFTMAAFSAIVSCLNQESTIIWLIRTYEIGDLD